MIGYYSPGGREPSCTKKGPGRKHLLPVVGVRGNVEIRGHYPAGTKLVRKWLRSRHGKQMERMLIRQLVLRGSP